MLHYFGYFGFKPKRAKIKEKEVKKVDKRSRVFILFGLKGEERVGVLGVFKCRIAAERRMNRVEAIKYKTDKDEFPYYFEYFVIEEYGVIK